MTTDWMKAAREFVEQQFPTLIHTGGRFYTDRGPVEAATVEARAWAFLDKPQPRHVTTLLRVVKAVTHLPREVPPPNDNMGCVETFLANRCVRRSGAATDFETVFCVYRAWCKGAFPNDRGEPQGMTPFDRERFAERARTFVGGPKGAFYRFCIEGLALRGAR